MIRGIGCDLCDSRRLEKMDSKYPTQFINRIFTKIEQAYCNSKEFKFMSYAKRFAAKEAVVKCLVNSNGLSWQDIEIINDPDTGAPHIYLHNNAHSRALEKSGESGYDFHISLSDEAPYGMAVVVFESI